MNYLLQNATGNKTSWYANVTSYLYLSNLPVALTRIVPFAGCENFSVWQGTGEDQPDESYWDTFQDGCVKLATAFVDACATGWDLIVSGQLFEVFCDVMTVEWMMGAAKAVGEKLNEIKENLTDVFFFCGEYELTKFNRKILEVLLTVTNEVSSLFSYTDLSTKFANLCADSDNETTASAFLTSFPNIETTLLRFNEAFSPGLFATHSVTKIDTTFKQMTDWHFSPFKDTEASSSYTPPSGAVNDSRDKDSDGINETVEGAENDTRTDLYIEVDWLQGWKPKTEAEVEGEKDILLLISLVVGILVGIMVGALLVAAVGPVGLLGGVVAGIVAGLIAYGILMLYSWLTGYGNLKSAPLPYIERYFETKGITVQYKYSNEIKDNNGEKIASDTKLIHTGETDPRFTDSINWNQIEINNHDDLKAVYMIFIGEWGEDPGKSWDSCGALISIKERTEMCKQSNRFPASYYVTVTAIHELGHSIKINKDEGTYGYCTTDNCFMTNTRNRFLWGYSSSNFCDDCWAEHRLREKYSVEGDDISEW